MKATGNSILSGSIAFVLGLMLVIWPGSALRILVIAVGVLFITAAVVSLVAYMAHSRNAADPAPRFPIEGCGSLLFGILLIVMPDLFIKVLLIILGVMLMLAALQQLVYLTSIRRQAPVSPWFYLLPALVLAGGAVITFKSFEVAKAAFVICGVICMVYGLSGIVSGIRFRKATRQPTPIDNQ